MHSTSTVALFVLIAVVLAVLLTMLVFALCHTAKHPEDFQDAKVPDDWPEAPYKIEPPSEVISKHLHASGGLMVTREGVNHIAPYKIEPPSESIAKQLYATGGILNPDGKQVVYFADVPEDTRRIRFPGGSDFEKR